MEPTKGQQNVLDANGHLLVTGGPGSGKTTISIIKAAQIAEQHIRPCQKILFLSFARATVSRVVEAIEYEQKIPVTTKHLIDIDTYHAFFWRILKTHGYLIGLPRRLEILTPPNEAIALSGVRSGFPARNLSNKQKQAKKNAEAAKRTHIAMNEGRICFDLFAPYVGDILHGSERIRNLIATMYPVIILDEFQDTNDAQWCVVQALGKSCRLIALADPEQRIYDWIGADPARLDHFRKAFTPAEVDLGADNHRSAGTEIVIFGNDLLTGKFRQQEYKGVVFDVFDPFHEMTKLVATIYAARKRLMKKGIENWSLAVLVPTKKLTRLVSDALCHPPAGMAEVLHTATIEMEAAILGAEVIGLLMQPSRDDRHFAQFIDLLCNYFQGKDGDKPTQGALKEAVNIRGAYKELLTSRASGKSIRKNSILVNVLAVYHQACTLVLTGDPYKDWLSVRRALENGACKHLKEIAEEVKNIRLLDRGTQLRQELSRDWLDNGYRNALAIIRHAFVKEHFSTSAKPESGVVVMNMHKAKGKQFDEVIIFEGWPKWKGKRIVANPDRIVRSNSRDQIDDQARRNFRVSVTRGKRQTTILTPKNDRCVLLIGKGNCILSMPE